MNAHANGVTVIQNESPCEDVTDAFCTGITTHASVQTSSSFGASLENATAIWVDLLLQDAAMQEFEFSSINLEPEGVVLLSNSAIQSPAIGRFPQKKSGEPLSPAPCTSNPYLQERVPDLSDYQQIEKQTWSLATPLHILPDEHVVFRNFVEHISQWASAYSHSGHTITDSILQLDGLIRAQKPIWNNCSSACCTRSYSLYKTIVLTGLAVWFRCTMWGS